MKTNRFKISLFAILSVYSFLYIATTKKEPICDWCQKINDAGYYLKNNRPYVLGTYPCGVSTNLCIKVNDSILHDWNALADTACMYLKSQNLSNYRTIITNQIGDTLVNRNCP